MGKKPEVNLEVGSGFFRITADEIIFNITVLEKVAQVLSPVQKVPCAPPVEAAIDPAGIPGGQEDDYYRQVSIDLYRDIGQLAKSLSSTMMHIPLEDRRLKRVELDEAGEKIEDAKNQLKDIVEMTESATMEIMDRVEHIQGQTVDVQKLLELLKDHPAFSLPETEDGSPPQPGPDKSEIAAQLERASRIVERLRRLERLDPSPASQGEQNRKGTGHYRFSLETIFQTLYEFCTNETVKGHLNKVRADTASLFDHPAVLKGLNELVAGMEPDSDNFFQLPLADLLGVLDQGCTDAKIRNLFKRMQSSQDTIFLDQSLPLEKPPLEPAESPAGPDPLVLADAGEDRGGDLDELGHLLEASLAGLAGLPAGGRVASPGMSTMSMADQTEIFAKIEAAFSMVSNIAAEVQKITEALSFQDLSGQQIMKIIKLLSDFQVQLLALVVSFGSQLKHKERNADITPEESKRLAQEEVDSYINRISGAEEHGGPAVLNQEAVNQILEDMGF